MNILITGGTGSLGNALLPKLLDIASKVVIYSRDEMKQDVMSKTYPSDKVRYFIGDVRDLDRLKMAMDNINIVIHAAALKIVPTAEYNPFECIKTNVLGAQNVIDAALYSNAVRKVLAVSTDKAVSPINLYGASKLCAEKLFVAANNINRQYGPKFSVVRYGNVVGSRGSVIPLFKDQLAKYDLLTVTDYGMTRYWITLDEAVALILRSLDEMKGGEVFVPNMESFKIEDLAKAFEAKEIHKSGIRPGEKLHETIIAKEEMRRMTYAKNGIDFIVEPEWRLPVYEWRPTEEMTSWHANRLSQTTLRQRLQELGYVGV